MKKRTVAGLRTSRLENVETVTTEGDGNCGGTGRRQPPRMEWKRRQHGRRGLSFCESHCMCV